MEYFEDGLNVRSNRVTITGAHCGPVYNAVLNVSSVDISTSEPVSIDEAKDWCKIDGCDDDKLILSLITAARIICENHSNLSFIKKTITAKIKNGLGGIILPFGPVIGDVKEDTTLIDLDEPFGTKTVTYDAGYDKLPMNLKNALLNQIGFLYDNRGDAKLQSGLSEEAKLILNQVRSV